MTRIDFGQAREWIKTNMRSVCDTLFAGGKYRGDSLYFFGAGQEEVVIHLRSDSKYFGQVHNYHIEKHWDLIGFLQYHRNLASAAEAVEVIEREFGCSFHFEERAQPTGKNPKSRSVPIRPGVPESVLTRAGVHYSDFPEPDSIEIPFFDIDGKPTNFSRWRLPFERQSGQKYYQQPGTGTHVYFGPNGLQKTQRLALTEGEFKAMTLEARGYTAIGLTNFLTYNRDELEAPFLLPEIRAALERTGAREVLFIGDSDTATNIEFSRSAQFLASAIAPIPVRLPRLALHGQKGIDDLAEATGEAFQTQLELLIREAPTVDPEASFIHLARTLLELEVPNFAKLTDSARAKQCTRVIRMCAIAQNNRSDSAAAQGLLALALKLTGLGKRALANAIKEELSAHHAKVQAEKFKLPPVMAPGPGRLESTVATQIGELMAPSGLWFLRNNELVTIKEVATGFQYSPDQKEKFKILSYSYGFDQLSGIKAKFSLETVLTPTAMVRPAPNAPPMPAAKSFTTDFCNGLIHSPQLKNQLPVVTRILTCPLPMLIDGANFIYPNEGYDRRFGTFLVPGAPKLYPMDINEAIRILKDLLQDFCIKDGQSQTHAWARLLTPFMRGIMGWTTRTPLWAFLANRPRAGKDFLAVCTIVLYDGQAAEDPPISKNHEETYKRLTAAASAGRRFMHFSNCEGHLTDPFLTQAITNPRLGGRRLGFNDASADLSLPNEMEFSFSGNVGLSWQEDLSFRMRQIHLAFYQEDPNSRSFRDPLLHHSIAQNRDHYLSAVAACWTHYLQIGQPKAPSPFTSYPIWGSLAGGLCHCLQLGDPCLPQSNPEDFAGDPRTEAMRALYKLAFSSFPTNPWLPKSQITKCLAQTLAAADCDESLSWFGSFDEDKVSSTLTRLGMALRAFDGRELSGIKLLIDKTGSNSQRDRFKFIPVTP